MKLITPILAIIVILVVFIVYNGMDVINKCEKVGGVYVHGYCFSKSAIIR
jgi:hypothetical protein